jgi:GT2 family glycosyltransferase
MPATYDRGMASPAHVAIVVLNWNRWEKTLACLASLDELEYPRYSVVVVDNASSDGSVERIRAARPDVMLLESDRNLGYAGGNNIGTRHALAEGADFVWILNNDTEVEPGSLTAMLEDIPTADCGIVSPCLLELESGEILATAGTGVEGIGEAIVCTGCEEGYHPAERLMGASLLVRREVLEQIGLMDETYFHYFEERDFVERARRAGFGIGLTCRAHVRHEEGGTLGVRSPQATYYFVRNNIFYERRFTGRHPLLLVASGTIMVRRHLALRHALRTRDFRGVEATLWGIVDAVRDRAGFRDLGRRYGRPLGWA